MNRQQILDLYQWEDGICFRHPAAGEQPTAHIQTIKPAAGGIQDVRACPACLLELEREREEAAAQEGAAYFPGRLGEPVGR